MHPISDIPGVLHFQLIGTCDRIKTDENFQYDKYYVIWINVVGEFSRLCVCETKEKNVSVHS